MELLYQIGLTLIPNVGPITAKQLLSYCGSPRAVFKSNMKDLKKIPGVGIQTIQAIKKKDVLKAAESEIRYVEHQKIKPLFYTETPYPDRLRNIADAPLLLYCKGNVDLNHFRTLSIVGTRKPSRQGVLICEELVESLKSYDVIIISGLAYGVDITAHKTALKHRIPTVGVVGHGLRTIYPANHKNIAKQMEANGGIVTEYPSKTLPDGRHFPMRNRIIAGLSDVVVVIETANKGGSIITANIANSYNKDVFAIPGRLSDPASSGCNWLIKTHKAALLEKASDIGYIMNWENKPIKHGIQRKLFLDLNQKEKSILNLFQTSEQLGVDFIAYNVNMKTSEVSSLVLDLEFKGLLRPIPGNQYVRIR